MERFVIPDRTLRNYFIISQDNQFSGLGLTDGVIS